MISEGYDECSVVGGERGEHVSGLLHRNDGDGTSPEAMSGCWPQARLRREGDGSGARVGCPDRFPFSARGATSRPGLELNGSPSGTFTSMWIVLRGAPSGKTSFNSAVGSFSSSSSLKLTVR